MPAEDFGVVPSRPPGEEPLPYPCPPKHDNTALQHRKSSTRTPPSNYPNWQLSAGKMQAAAGDSAVQIRSNPALAGNSVGVGVVPAWSLCFRATRPAPWALQQPPPLLRLERFQGRGSGTPASALAQQCYSSSCFSYSLFSSPCPQLQLPQLAPPLPPSSASCSLLANFPQALPAAQISPAAWGPLQTAGC